ncbi:MAG: DUF1302 family protein [Myxococcota bacterium]
MKTIRRQVILSGWLLGAISLIVQSAAAVRLDLWEGADIEVHGFYETQVRAIARDMDFSDGLDLTQWYHILNLEAEFEFAEDGIGPFDVLQGFMRVEVRYDCVWTRACSIFPSANAYGDRAQRLPKRLSDGRRAGYRSTGTIFNGDTRYLRDTPREFLPWRFRDRPGGSRKPSEWFNVQGIDTLFDSAGADGMFGTDDDPAPFYFSRALADCDFTFRRTKGSMDGVGHQTMIWNPCCSVRPIGFRRDKPNPLRAGDVSPITGLGGSGALPFRPAPEHAFDSLAPNDSVAQGIYFPNERLTKMLRDGEFDSFDQNFRQSELAWNRGASQQDEKELKEAYLDIEMFDSSLWMRIGKQSVVWGKTELFRNQDRWNPQDLALASLPSLEESRIGLWMARFVWQFWNVGPLEDVRAELIFSYDNFEPTDLGRCGEPYSPNPVCNKTFGLFAHGHTGLALAGEVRPQNPWNSWSGIEVGGRVEWRWDRFSFAVTDFYGFNDLGYQDTIFRYSRNVDPVTGRPRAAMETGRCKTGRDGACLKEGEALTRQSSNQQLFHMICATSIGFSDLDTASCAQTLFNSPNRTDEPGEAAPRVIVALNSVVAGDPSGAILPGLAATLSGIDEASAVSVARQAAQLTKFGVSTPTVVLNIDPADGGTDYPAGHPLLAEPDFLNTVDFFYTTLGGSLSARLTDQQEALLGCGPLYQTSCDLDGIDLMNSEASALFQSFPGFEGTSGDWDTTDGSVAQPGTTGFQGGAPCTRYSNGKTYVLPGCRGPGDDGYDPNVDGTATGLIHPFTKQRFRSEMAVVSWNALMGLVAFSAGPDGNEDEFLVDDILRTNGCSYRKPQYCSIVQSFFQVTGVQRNSLRAGGNLRFGRRDFVWHGGRDLALRYQKFNVLGFSMDFAEDVTKSNWGLEFTWEENVLVGDNDAFSGLEEVDRYNLTVSIDRPTFINFLNANRTFFINSQVFFQYVQGHGSGHTGNGPWNVLGVLAVNTGYFDDRLLPSMTLVYDMRSNSGAFIPQVLYRFNSEFSASFGMALFIGREERRDMAISPNALSNRTGRHANKDFVENGLSAVRDRDEFFLRIRYTF